MIMYSSPAAGSVLFLSIVFTSGQVGGLRFVITADTMRPKKIVIAIIIEHVTPFTGVCSSGIILDVVRTPCSFRWIRGHLNLVDIIPERTEVEIVVAARQDQTGINLTKSAFMFSNPLGVLKSDCWRMASSLLGIKWEIYELYV
jgi:hypothetical protein